MPFDLKHYIKTDFKEVAPGKRVADLSMEELRQVAQSILKAEDTFGALGSKSPIEWATQVTWILNGAGSGTPFGSLDEVYDENRSGQRVTVRDEITRWLGGQAQKGRNVTFKENLADIEKQLNEAQANIQTMLDNAAAAKTDAKRQEFLAQVDKEYKNEIAGLQPLADSMGITVKPPVKDANGNYIPAGQEAMPGAVPGGPQASTVGESRVGQTTTVRQQPDGTYAIVGADGSVIQGGFTDIAGALAKQQEVSGGFSEQPQQPQVPVEREPVTPITTETPPAGAEWIRDPKDLEGLTEDQIWRGPDGKIYRLPPGTTGEQTGTDGTATPTKASWDDFLKGLPSDLQAMIGGLDSTQRDLLRLTYEGLTAGNEALMADTMKALDDAIKLADPYSKEQIRMAQDEIMRGVTSEQEDAKSNVGKLQTRIDQINQDLAFNRDQLSLEEQASLSAQLRQYKRDLTGLQSQMVEAGLAFSSPRAEAERELSEEQQILAESVRRRTSSALRNLEVGSLRGIQDAQQGIADTTRQSSERIADIFRQGEQRLGTAGLGSLPPELGTVAPVGGITGTIEEGRQQAILDLENTLLGRLAPQQTI